MKISRESNFNLFLLALLLALIFLFFGVFLGFYYFKNSLFQDLVSKNIDLHSPEYNNANLVIQDPKKVYISQDLKIEEAVNYFEEAVFSLLAKNDKEVYRFSDALLDGILISSDGWILVNSFSQESIIKNIEVKKNSYVLLSKKNKDIYSIEEAYYFPKIGLSFLKIKNDKHFPVRNFVKQDELRVGQSVLAYNSSGQLMINYLKKIESDFLFKNFVDNYDLLELNVPLDSSFKNSFLFNLNGDLIALIDADLKVRPVYNFKFGIYSFLKNNEFGFLDLGFYYTNLKNWAGKELLRQGAWIYNNGLNAIVKGGLADKAGLKDGDIILKVNGREIDTQTDLRAIINDYSTSDRLVLSVLRGEDLLEIKIDLK